jgi:uncharacterized protein YndB with AHSA1/START domain
MTSSTEASARTAARGCVSVSRRIDAPAGRLFALLADSANHPLIDGSGMVREPAGAVRLTAVGDLFRMNMHHAARGDYQMQNEVVEYQADRLLVWQPGRVEHPGPDGQDVIDTGWYRWGFELSPDGPGATKVTETFDCSRSPEGLRDAVREGEGWRDAMTASLVKLDLLAKAAGPR